MANYDNTNTGGLFTQDNVGDKRPDYKGTINFEGQEKELAGWIRVSKKNGSKFLSLKVQDKWVKPEAKQDAYNKSNFVADEEMPF